MPDRQMFWRVIRRILASNRARLAVILLALGSGAAITAALLNLEVDAKRRLTTEFRAFGPNVMIVPRSIDSSKAGMMPEFLVKEIPEANEGHRIASVGWLSTIATAVPHLSGDKATNSIPVVVVGSTCGALQDLLNKEHYGPPKLTDGLPYCNVGTKAAFALNVHEHDRLILRNGVVEETCAVWSVNSYGGQEDNQIFVHIGTAQRLAQLPGKISLIEVVVPGTPESVERFIHDLRTHFSQSDVEVRPIRQFTEGEARIYNRISGILSATVALVLILTALCVMAAMTNVAMERRNDVGLMKAIGGATRRVLRLFLAEAALLGLAGGVIGAALGILLSIWLGKQVFGQPAHPRLIVYPVAVGLTMIVAIAGAYPLRRLANVRPASVFRGEA